MTPDLCLVADLIPSEEEAVILAQTSQNAYCANITWNCWCVPMNVNVKDMNTCMVGR